MGIYEQLSSLADQILGEVEDDKTTRKSSSIVERPDMDLESSAKGMKRAIQRGVKMGSMAVGEEDRPEFKPEEWMAAIRKESNNDPMDYSDMYPDEDDTALDSEARPTGKYKTEDSLMPRPRLRGEGGDTLTNTEKGIKLQRESGDDEYTQAVQELADEFNVTTTEIYSIVHGESKGDPTVVNSGGYKGLFQIGEDAANDVGLDYANIEKMKPSDQVRAYAKYLRWWGYDGSVPLALMQAAPDLARRMKGKPSDTVIYSKNSKSKQYRAAWNANPGWRTSSDGPITLGSLSAYYGGRS